MSIFKIIWSDTVKFVEFVWNWIETEAEDFWNNGGSAVIAEMTTLAEQAFTAWVATQPANAIFSDFVSFASGYIKNNWKTDLGILEDAAVTFVLGLIGIKYQIPSVIGQNQGILTGGDQGAS